MLSTPNKEVIYYYIDAQITRIATAHMVELRKVLFSLLLILGSKSTFGQFDRCAVVNYAISTDDFKEFIEKLSCDTTIILFDPAGRVSPCSVQPVGCHTIAMNYDTIYDKLSPNRYDRNVSRYLMVAYWPTEGKEISIGFWKPSNNQTLRFYLKPRKKGFSIKHVDHGVF